ncbi:MAG: DUF924 domain-containing protein [Granulosicoccus sp.]|nr:DUF924 domain-containing protein [Granulosicoccus sp.]
MATKPVSIEQVHDYWFGTDPSPDLQERSKLWFNGGVEVDNEIRKTFGPSIDLAGDGKLDDWQSTSKGTTALIILLDQFPLNAFRKTAKAFAFEEAAVAACLQGLEKEFDQQVSIAERLFFYLPLVHSENIEHHDQAVLLFEKLADDAAGPEKKFAEYSLESALEHREQIKRFGRYPFRNEVLDRNSSDEEIAWLNDNPDRYGQ